MVLYKYKEKDTKNFDIDLILKAIIRSKEAEKQTLYAIK